MRYIRNEEPIEHWGYLDIKDKVILDLGCGKFQASISTAEWFIQNGASKVIGVDLEPTFISHPQLVYHSMEINSPNNLIGLISEYNPDIIKADIEGAEEHFEPLENILNVKQFVIEYHSSALKQLILRKLNEWGFNDIEEIQLLSCNINEQGVIYARK